MPMAIQSRPEGTATTNTALDVIASGPAGGSEVITQKSAGPNKSRATVGASSPSVASAAASSDKLDEDSPDEWELITIGALAATQEKRKQRSHELKLF